MNRKDPGDIAEAAAHTNHNLIRNNKEESILLFVVL